MQLPDRDPHRQCGLLLSKEHASENELELGILRSFQWDQLVVIFYYIMQYENTIPKRKISENLFGPREGCVGPDYSASLSHLFLSLNHMHLSFLASDFLHPVGLSDFGMAQVPAQQGDSAEDMM